MTKKDIILIILLPIWLPIFIIGSLISLTIHPLICGYSETADWFDKLFEIKDGN